VAGIDLDGRRYAERAGQLLRLLHRLGKVVVLVDLVFDVDVGPQSHDAGRLVRLTAFVWTVVLTGQGNSVIDVAGFGGR
jgi:hypothetical protein